jgi:hypothetical protein
MTFRLAGGFQRVCRHTRRSSCCLARHRHAVQARALELLHPSLQELPSAPLRVEKAANVIMQVQNSNRSFAVVLGPQGEALQDFLPPTIAFLDLANSVNRIDASESNQ